MCWAQSINTLVAAGIGGIGHTHLDPISAAKLFFRVSLAIALYSNSVSNRAYLRQCLWIEGFPLSISLATIKISILLLYKRIFFTKRFRLACNIMSGILAAWATAAVFVGFIDFLSRFDGESR